MINRSDWVEDLQKNISDLIAKSPAADIERNVKAMMAQTFSRLDLVTREEFDIQVQLLERAMTRLTALESRVQALEGRPDTPLHSGAHSGPV
ncbi:MAG TPA: accessory factor UbiK family protein [Candidimonas sp.]|nr:accessory factor UbiK family protein [Candidimonas sp.]